MDINEERIVNTHVISGNKQEGTVIPGTSMVRRYRPDSTPTKLLENQTFNINIQGLTQSQAIVGKDCYVRFRVKATNAAGANLSLADQVALREEAANMVIDKITLYSQGSMVYSVNDSQVVRHVVDRYFTSLADKNNGGLFHRYIGKDSDLQIVAGSYASKYQNQIVDGKYFELICPLNHLALFGANDALIPSFVNLRLEITTSGRLQQMFQSSTVYTGGLVQLEIERIEVVTTVVELDRDVATVMFDSAARGAFEMDGTSWDSRVISNISAGSTDASSQPLQYANIPNMLVALPFMSSRFNQNTVASHLEKHALLTNWDNWDSVTISDGSRQIVNNSFLRSGGRGEFLMSLKNSISSPGGVFNHDRAAISTSTVDGAVFVDNEGLGAYIISYNNFDTQLSHTTTPAAITLELRSSTPSANALSMYIVSATRERFLLTPNGLIRVR